MKPILCLILVALGFSGCSNRLRNRVDPNVVECGLTQDQVVGKRLIRPDFLMVKDQVQLFDGSGTTVGDFDVTEKNCLLLAEDSPAVAMVYGNSVAGWLGQGKVEFKSCGADCAVFPVCGYFGSSSTKAGTWVYARVPNVEDKDISAIFEGESGPLPVSLSDRSCLKVNIAEKGVLKVTDSDGNFFEANVQDMVIGNPKVGPLMSLTLRSPLTRDEAFCRKNSDSYKLVDGVCHPKDLRDYCSDWHLMIRKKELDKFFGTDDCDRIWRGFSQSAYLGVGAMHVTSTKYFSGLPKLKGLNLSGNPDLGSFSEMKGTDNVEELIVHYANFDLHDIQYFPKLRSVELYEFQKNWNDAPVFYQVKELKIMLFHNDPSLLSKFPNLEKLTIHGTDDGSSLKILGSLKHLKELAVTNDGVVPFAYKDIPDLDSLEFLSVVSLQGFTGKFPKLKRVRMWGSKNFKALTKAPLLEELEIANSDWSELSGVVLPSVKKLKIGEFPDFNILTSFPALQEFEGRSMESIGEFSDLKELHGLKRLKFMTGKAKLRGVDFPELQYLEVGGNCAFSNMSAPKLETFACNQGHDRNLDFSGFNMPRLKSLTVNTDDVEEPEEPAEELLLPNLQELEFLSTNIGLNNLDSVFEKAPFIRQLKICMRENDQSKKFPKTIESLDVYKSRFFDLNILNDLPSLKNLKISFGNKLSGKVRNDLSLNTLDYVGNIEPGMFSKVTVVEALTIGGDLKFLDNVDFSQAKKLIMYSMDQIDDMTSKYASLAKIEEIDIESWEGFGMRHPLMNVFPGLRKLKINRMFLNNWLNEVLPVVSIEKLLPPQTEINTFGDSEDDYYKDAERKTLGCDRFEGEPNVYGEICFPIDTGYGEHYKYRPFSNMGVMDFEM